MRFDSKTRAVCQNIVAYKLTNEPIRDQKVGFIQVLDVIMLYYFTSPSINPFAKSYRNQPLSTTFALHEKEKNASTTNESSKLNMVHSHLWYLALMVGQVGKHITFSVHL